MSGARKVASFRWRSHEGEAGSPTRHRGSHAPGMQLREAPPRKTGEGSRPSSARRMRASTCAASMRTGHGAEESSETCEATEWSRFRGAGAPPSDRRSCSPTRTDAKADSVAEGIGGRRIRADHWRFGGRARARMTDTGEPAYKISPRLWRDSKGSQVRRRSVSPW